MKQSINYPDFHRNFKAYDRLDNFPTGLRELFDYLEQYEQDCDTEIELDVISLCCDYSEEKLSVVLKDYNIDSLDELRDNTTVIMVDDESDDDPTIIYQNY